MALRSQPQAGLGRAIRELREQRELTQEDLAHAAGLTTAALARIEQGKVNPTWATVKATATSLDMSLVDVAALAERYDRMV